MDLRRPGGKATKRIIPAFATLVLAAAGSATIAPARSESALPPNLPRLAQADKAAPPHAVIPVQRPDRNAAPALVRAAASADDALQPPDTSGAVFDAPGMPGVRMMAPIQDKPLASKSVAAPALPPAPAPRVTSDADRALLQQAFIAAGRDWNRARLLAAQAGNPVGRLIVEWRYVLDEMSGANFETIAAFLNEHPNWPRHDTLTVRAEKAMAADFEPRQVIGWYANRTPLSGIGMIRLGDALIQSGQRAEGAALVRRAWIQFTFSPSDENQIVTAHADILGAADQKARLDHLLANDDIGGATRQLRRVDGEAQRIANARLRIKASPALVKTVLASLPESAQANPELLFDVARALRRSGKDDDAWLTMAKAPTDRYALSVADRWSVERQIMARDALKAGKFELAYQFASTPVLNADSGTTFMEAEFLAGWIALRYLHNPELAFIHFDRLAKGVTFPISVARAHYWLGRTAETANRPADAAAEYKRAAEHPATFYGQLALAKLGENPILHVNAVTAEPSLADRTAFEADDRVRAIRLLGGLGDRATTRLFAASIANDPPNPARLQLLAQTMTDLGDRAMSVRVAKYASYSDLNLLSYLHPVMSVPRVADAPETALVLGLARQESEFDAGAVSSAGAQGLMQLMPASARRAASMRGLAYRPNNLSDPSYNMQLGMATLTEQLERWDGSYILAIASYNAGPKNVRNWTEMFGDPRDPSTDPIDWIECIPFPETRNYVQRVLENLEVYRNRLSNADQKLGILADLYRPGPVNVATGSQPSSIPVSGGPNPNAVPGATAGDP